MPMIMPKKAALTFTTTTTYLFHVAIGGSALPSETGPAIGLASTHFDVQVDPITPSKRCRRGRVRKFNHLERITLLKDAHFPVCDIAAYCSEAIDIRQSRAATVFEVRQQKRKLEQEARMAKHPRSNCNSITGCMWVHNESSDDDEISDDDDDA
ncbi:Aste57867_16851 [Aphanomyces stellatus]|uniref:Aste57867_16851 protein n=1 Tax=Aphanomyces stellatus TaxID=120398 RepID=A0A485L6R0_9STRA|nr:hypothetical protein As57867_016793 [Aphanomyces stellatus]VFT93615.1 Aste57867_16851 [Aphanomyces stellatus]